MSADETTPLTARQILDELTAQYHRFEVLAARLDILAYEQDTTDQVKVVWKARATEAVSNARDGIGRAMATVMVAHDLNEDGTDSSDPDSPKDKVLACRRCGGVESHVHPCVQDPIKATDPAAYEV